MTQPQHGPAPEVDLDPAAEHLTRHVSTTTSTALAATQHAMQAATLRAYIGRDSASTQARAAHRALAAQQQLARTAEATGRAADRAGLAPRDWSAYRDGHPTAALGGTGVSVPPEQVLAHTHAQSAATQPGTRGTAPGLAPELATAPASGPTLSPGPGPAAGITAPTPGAQL